jgi:hypothetical protein
MRKTIAGVALSLALTSSPAMADERVGDAALGALSGALVLGPIGAAAGALVGYTAGPPDGRNRADATISMTAQPPAPKSASAAPPVQPLE